MKNYIDRIEFLLSRYDYNELQPSDKKLADEMIGSEAAYNLLRKSKKQGLDSRGDLSISLDRKKELLKTFRSAKVKTSPVIFSLLNRRIPAYYSIAILLLSALSVVLILSSRSDLTPPSSSPVEVNYVEVPAKPDTVYLTGVTDTVFLERVVYRNVYLPADTVYQVVDRGSKLPGAKKELITSDVSTSIADNKALNDLMISID